MQVDKRLAILGGGRLGEALLRGVLDAGARSRGDVHVTVRTDKRATELAERYSVNVTAGENATAVARSNFVVLAVKPGVISEVLKDVRKAVRPDQVLISMAAAVPLRLVESLLPAPMPVVRVMPNIAIAVRESATALCANEVATHADRAAVEALFQTLGTVHFVDESAMNAATALSGSGPGYAFLIANALAEAGAEQGLPRDVSLALVQQTLLGAARLLATEVASPAEMIRQVATPGGTTVEGLRALEHHGVPTALRAAVAAATARSEVLTNELVSQFPFNKPIV